MIIERFRVVARNDFVIGSLCLFNGIAAARADYVKLSYYLCWQAF